MTGKNQLSDCENYKIFLEKYTKSKNSKNNFKFILKMWKNNLVGSQSFITFVSSVTVKCVEVYKFGDLSCQLLVS
jgi:hypothetical protein